MNYLIPFISMTIAWAITFIGLVKAKEKIDEQDSKISWSKISESNYQRDIAQYRGKLDYAERMAELKAEKAKEEIEKYYIDLIKQILLSLERTHEIDKVSLINNENFEKSKDHIFVIIEHKNDKIKHIYLENEKNKLGGDK